MNLKYAELKNFRSIKEARIEFNENCKILLGINESGKTNILRALRLVSKDILPQDDDVRQVSHEESIDLPAKCTFVFEFSDSEWEYISSEVKKLIATGDDSEKAAFTLGKYEIPISDLFLKKREALYVVNLKLKTKYYAVWRFSKNYKSAPGWYKIPKSLTRGTISLIINDENIDAVNFRIVNGSLLKDQDKSLLEPATPEDFNDIYGQVAGDFLERNHPEVVFWNYSDDYLLPERILTTSFLEDPDTCIPLKHMFLLAGVTDISTTIQGIKSLASAKRNLLSRVAAKSTQYLHESWPDYNHLHFEIYENGDFIECVIKDSFNSFGMDKRSDGFKRFVSFILSISVKKANNDLKDVLFIQDEPDTNLHPSATRYLLSEMLKISENNKVIFSTHSIFMIDREKIERHYIVEKHNEVTSVKVADISNIADEEVLYNALGYSIFEVLKNKNIIFEGWKDKRCFRIAVDNPKHGYASLKKLSQIGTCHSVGVKDIERVASFLELASRKFIIVSDSDAVARQKQQLYRGDGIWYRYDELIDLNGEFTLEDFIDHTYIKAKVIEIISKDHNIDSFGEFVLSEDVPVLSVISNWLGRNNIRGDFQKNSLRLIKDAIIEEIDVNKFTNRYWEILRAIELKLKSE